MLTQATGFFDKKKSIELKGLAIIFMFWLHLYCHDKFLADGIYYTSIIGGHNLITIRLLTSLFRICVPLYLFIAGYAVGIKNNNLSILPKIKTLYFKLWISFAAMVSLCLICHSIIFNYKEFLLNLSGFYYTYCGEWWFFGLYIELKILSSFLVKVSRLSKDNTKYIFFVSIFFMLFGYSLKIILGNLIAENLLINNIYMFLIEQPIYISGYICGESRLLDKICKRLKSHGPYKYLVLMVWLIKLTPIPQALYMPFIIPMLVALFSCIDLPKVISKFLYFLGIKSTYMWLTHSFLIYKLPTQNLIYYYHISIVNIIILLLLDIPVAIILNNIEKQIFIIIEKIKKRLSLLSIYMF